MKINYNDIAKEWLHGVLFREANEFGDNYQQIQEDMEEEHGEQFDMDEFVTQLTAVENELYKILGANNDEN